MQRVDGNRRDNPRRLATRFVNQGSDASLHSLTNDDNPGSSNEPVNGVAAFVHPNRNLRRAPRASKLILDERRNGTNLPLKVLVHESLSDLTENDEEYQQPDEHTTDHPDDSGDDVDAGDREYDSSRDGRDERQPEPQPRERYALEDEFQYVDEFADATLLLFGCHDVLTVPGRRS